ncbi:MAG: hypothetical protein IPP44_15355 [Ideonella sp.]|nr:hypothetical protein [Ideonella sp.]
MIDKIQLEEPRSSLAQAVSGERALPPAEFARHAMAAGLAVFARAWACASSSMLDAAALCQVTIGFMMLFSEDRV